MKIRNRISYTFTGLFAVLILGFCLLIYVVSSSTLDELFYNRVNSRLEITEKFFLEKDKFSESVKSTVQQNFLKTLPQEIEYVDTLSSFSIPSTMQSRVPLDLKSSLKNRNEISWVKSDYQGIARIYTVDEIDYVVLVAAFDKDGATYLKKLRSILAFSFFCSLLIIFVLSKYFSRNVLKPIAGKIKKANNISASNLDMRLTVHNEHDELGMLALSFNSLLDRLQTSFELEKNFVRYASHEIKNPLAVILGEAEVTLLKERSSKEYIESIDKIMSTAGKLNQLVEHFLNLSKMDSAKLSLKKTGIDSLLMDITFSLSQIYKQIDLQFDMEENSSSEDYEYLADEPLLHNALYNIVENACKYSNDNAIVSIDLCKRDGKIQITTTDNGIGIPEDQINHIFEPLYRAHNAQNNEGAGIGLSLVKRIIELHEGDIHVQSDLDKGTVFSVLL
ncbi:MAG: signal transduction histidine kinase [Salibacteraceae bacterium]|jgi:signal transduction histidine kinase